MAMTMQELEDFIRAKEKDVRQYTHRVSLRSHLLYCIVVEFKKRVQANIRERQKTRAAEVEVSIFTVRMVAFDRIYVTDVAESKGLPQRMS